MQPLAQAKAAAVTEKTVAKKADGLFQQYMRATMQASQLQKKVAGYPRAPNRLLRSRSSAW